MKTISDYMLIRKRIMAIVMIIVTAFIFSAVNTVDVQAATKPSKCPKCNRNYSIVRQTTIQKKVLVSNKIVWKRIGEPVRNDSNRAIMLGGFQSNSKSTTVKYTGSISWKNLNLGASYTKSNTITYGYFAGDYVKPGYWCNTYGAQKVDVCRIDVITTDKCPHCGYSKKIKHEIATINLPKKYSDKRIKFVTGKTKASVNKEYW